MFPLVFPILLREGECYRLGSMSLDFTYVVIGLMLLTLGTLIFVPYSGLPSYAIWIRLCLLVSIGGFSIFGFLASFEFPPGTARLSFLLVYGSLFLGCLVSVYRGLRRLRS